MSEWLTEKKLDRKLLGTLAANLAAAEAWEDFQSDEVLNVLEELVADVAGEPREAPTPLQLTEIPDEEVSPILSLLIARAGGSCRSHGRSLEGACGDLGGHGLR